MCEVSQKPKLILSSCWVLLKLTCQKGKGSSLRTADVFPVVASLPEEEKRRPEMRLLFAGYKGSSETSSNQIIHKMIRRRDPGKAEYES